MSHKKNVQHAVLNGHPRGLGKFAKHIYWKPRIKRWMVSIQGAYCGVYKTYESALAERNKILATF